MTTRMYHWLTNILGAIAIASGVLFLVVAGCHNDPKPTPPLLQPGPDRVGPTTLPQPTTAPATSAEWVELTNELDDARAERDRLAAELKATLESRALADAATWKRLGSYSWLLIVPGVLIVIGSFLPWTSFLAPARSVGWLLLGIGTGFAILPHMLTTYGPLAFYPMALAVGGYCLALAILHIAAEYRRIFTIRNKAKLATNDRDRVKHLGAAAALERSINPKIDKAFKRDLLRV